MPSAEYNPIKLKQLCDIDVRSAVKNFNSYEDYFNKLYKFTIESGEYLRDYTAAIVIKDADRRLEFQDELRRIKTTLLSLGITYLIPTLSELDYESRNDDANTFENWLSKFYSEIESVSKSIAESQENPSQQAVPAVSNEDKPLILAVDDKPELLTAVVNMLEDKYRVMAVTSGSAVLKLLEKHTPALFLLDIEMPVMDGYMIAEKIRRIKTFERTPIIFLTSKNRRGYVLEAVKNGGNDYILKPVNKDILISKIAQNLNKA